MATTLSGKVLSDVGAQVTEIASDMKRRNLASAVLQNFLSAT
jgi:hypothetical protein